jgi:carbon monoxide dehydrogenase subunit G
MRLRLIGLIVLVISLPLSLSIRSLARADEADIETTLGDEKSTVDKDKQLRLDATARINAPADKVYDALTHPEKVAKYDVQITDVNVVSRDAKGETVEYKGQTLPIPNAPPSFRVQYSFDAATKSVSAKNAGKSPIQFQNHTELKPSKDGKGTDIHYTGVSSSTGPIMGFEPTEGMRTQFALSAFMRQMHNVGMYIQKGGK